MPKVFVTQEPVKTTNDRGEVYYRQNLKGAMKYGTIEMCVKAGTPPFALERVVRDVTTCLKDITLDDYILCLGSPVFIAIVTTIAARYNNGRVNLLVWDKVNKDYYPVELNL